jgi:AbrB family looped-hinge helix DNA binding protein
MDDQKFAGGSVVARPVISTKYQVVIPKEIRARVGIWTGQVVQIIAKNGVITLVPDRELSDLRGFLRGMDTRNIREKNERT